MGAPSTGSTGSSAQNSGGDINALLASIFGSQGSGTAPSSNGVSPLTPPPQAQTLPVDQTLPVTGPVQPQPLTAQNWTGAPLAAQYVTNRRQRAGMVYNPATGKMIAGDPTVNEYGDKYATTYIGKPQTNVTDPTGKYGSVDPGTGLYTPTPGRYITTAGDAQRAGVKWLGGYGSDAAQI